MKGAARADGAVLHWHSRPIRVLFVADNNPAEISLALQTATASFGGWWSPILVLDEKDRREELVRRFVTLYDPDWLVATNAGTRRWLEESAPKGLSVSDIEVWAKLDDDDLQIEVGLDSCHAYRAAAADDFHSNRYEPPETVDDLEQIQLVHAVFGRFSTTKRGMRRVREVFQNSCSPAYYMTHVEHLKYEDVYWRRAPTPLRIAGETGISARYVGPPPKSLLVLDESKQEDVLLFWNLRAYGYDILPISHARVDEFLVHVRQQLWMKAPSQNPDGGIEVLSAPGCDSVELATQLRSSTTRVVRDGNSYLSWFQGAQPSTADEPFYARVHLQFENSQTTSVVSNARKVQSVVSIPAAIARARAHRSFALVLERVHPDIDIDHEIATVFPRDIRPAGLSNLLRRYGGVDDCKTSSQGLVFFVGAFDEVIDLEFPSHSAVVEQWLYERDIEMEHSSAGRLAFQLVQGLGGASRAGLLAFPALLKQLNGLAHGLYHSTDDELERPPDRARTIASDELRRELRRMHDDKPALWGRDQSAKVAEHLSALMRHGVFRLGLKLQCSVCQQRSWYALEDLATSMRCDRCLREWDFPVADPPKESAWHYRSQGVFSVGEFAQGSYAVALLLRFFETCENWRVCWSSGVTFPQLGNREADLFCWASKGIASGPPQLLLAECKTFKRFGEKDVAAATDLNARFPDAILVFATLNSELTGEEKRLLNQVADALDPDGSQVPKLLILTGTELFANDYLSRIWSESNLPEHQRVAKTMRIGPSFEGECEATQEVYLGRLSLFDRRRRRNQG